MNIVEEEESEGEEREGEGEGGGAMIWEIEERRLMMSSRSSQDN